MVESSQNSQVKRLPYPEAVAFDCFRTLLTNDPAEWERMFDDVSREQGLRMPGSELWAMWKRHEVLFRERRLNYDDPAQSPPFKTYRQAWSECFASVFAETGLKGDPALAARRCVERMSGRPAFPEAVRALRHLSGRTRLAVLSNADEAFLRPSLIRMGVRFTVIVSSESASCYKPAAGAFDALLAGLETAPSRVWYVGDHMNEDVYGARSAGMTAIWVNRVAGQDHYAGHIGLHPSRTLAPDAEIADLSGIEQLFDAAHDRQMNGQEAPR